jgi:hypothetical protein
MEALRKIEAPFANLLDAASKMIKISKYSRNSKI